MNKFVVLCSLLFLIGNLCVIQAKITPIDEFNTNCPEISISEYLSGSSNPANWVNEENCVGDAGNPISAERNLRIQLTDNTIINENGTISELPYTTIETSVILGAWTTAVGESAQGNALIQWDGIDGTANLTYGLNVNLDAVASSFFFVYSAMFYLTVFFL